MLFAASRLDAIADERILSLVENSPSNLEEGERDLLLIGLAYSAYKQGLLDTLQATLNAITGPLSEAWDVPLLLAWLQNERGEKDMYEWERESLNNLESASESFAHGIVMREGAALLARMYASHDMPLPQWLVSLLNSSIIAIQRASAWNSTTTSQAVSEAAGLMTNTSSNTGYLS
jgi:hypothetical protein